MLIPIILISSQFICTKLGVLKTYSHSVLHKMPTRWVACLVPSYSCENGTTEVTWLVQKTSANKGQSQDVDTGLSGSRTIVPNLCARQGTYV